MQKLIEEQLFRGSGAEFQVNSTLTSIFSASKMEMTLGDNSVVSITHAELPNSLLSRVVIPTATHMDAARTAFYYMVLVKEGSIRYRIDAEEIRANAGDLVVVREGQHLERWSEAGIELLVLKLKDDVFQRVMSTYLEENLIEQHQLCSHLKGDDPKAQYFRRCMEHSLDSLLLMAEETQSNYRDEPYYNAILNNLESYLLRTALLALRKELPLAEELDNTNRTPLPRILVDAVKYINTRIQDPLHITECAAAMGVSQRTLSAAFQSHLNVTPKQYIKSQRLDGVHRELKQRGRDATVTDVAMKWGFNHLSWFAAEYKKRFGETPSDTARCVRPELDGDYQP
jgi:AraC-like DNA-binding protein